MDSFNKYFDHTLLKADASTPQILALCAEAARHGFASVCVNGSYVKTCAEALAGSGVRVACVVGFPLGAMAKDAKLFETRQAISDGASEIDTVINVGALKEGRFGEVSEELSALAEECHGSGALLKVIIETCLLTEEEKIDACRLVTGSGADYIKTSTGFSTGGATADDVRLLRAHVGRDVKIKASGGIRTLTDARAMIEAGADRLGCSASVQICEEYASLRRLSTS